MEKKLGRSSAQTVPGDLYPISHKSCFVGIFYSFSTQNIITPQLVCVTALGSACLGVLAASRNIFPVLYSIFAFKSSIHLGFGSLISTELAALMDFCPKSMIFSNLTFHDSMAVFPERVGGIPWGRTAWNGVELNVNLVQNPSMPEISIKNGNFKPNFCRIR